MLRNLSLILIFGIAAGQAISYLYTGDQAQTGADNFTWSIPQPADGEKLFKENCAACHSFDRNLTGPNLIGIFRKGSMDHWHKYMSSEHSPKFPQLTDEQMKEILAYVHYREAKSDYEKKLSEQSGAGAQGNTMASMLSGMESKLNTLFLNGNQDHDYLVSMMVLNYQASKKMAAQSGDSEIVSNALVNAISAQQKLFNLASGLLRQMDAGAEDARIPITTKTETIKSVERLQLEMKALSQRVISSSNNPSVVQFAERSLVTLNSLQQR